MLVLAVANASSASGSRAQSVLVSQKTTTYTHNADGALTGITITQSGGARETTTLTWDNYEPVTDAVRVGNGNLVSVRSSKAARTHVFDSRNRLIEASTAGNQVSYQHDPTSMMAVSTLDGGTDSLRFYYDQSANARAVNLVQASSAYGAATLSSARLMESRYVSDGDEQMLVRHRKDVSGAYTPSQQSFASYAYDPYGASSNEATPGSGGEYDLYDNPFQYSGEYQDPTTGYYYLRARVYDPTMQVFLSRDPVANLSRYGYARGNPVAFVDPSGRRPEPFLKGLEAGLFSGLTLGILPIVETAEAEGAKRFFGVLGFFSAHGAWQNYLQIVLTVGAAVTTAGSLTSADFIAAGRRTLFGATAKRILGVSLSGGTLLGVGQTALGLARHRGDSGLVGGELLGGLFGGALLTGGGAGFGGLVGRAEVAVTNWRQQVADFNELKGEVDIYTIQLHPRVTEKALQLQYALMQGGSDDSGGVLDFVRRKLDRTERGLFFHGRPIEELPDQADEGSVSLALENLRKKIAANESHFNQIVEPSLQYLEELNFRRTQAQAIRGRVETNFAETQRLLRDAIQDFERILGDLRDL